MPEPIDDKELEKQQQDADENAIGDLLENVDPVSGEIKPDEEVPADPPAPAPKPVGTAPEPKPEDQPAPNDPIDELDKELEQHQPPKKSHSGAAAGYKALKEVAKRERGETLKERQAREAAEKRIAELEEQLKSPKIPEDVENELKELRQLRKQINIENDPEFQQKYQAKLSEHEAKALDILVDAGMTPKTAEWVKSRGGVIAMSKSKAKMPDGQMTEMEWIEEVVLPKTPAVHRERVMRRIADALELADEMGAEIEKAKAEAPQRQKAQMEQVQKMFEEGKEEALAALGDMAKLKDIPKDATPEDKEKLEKHNQRVQKAEARFAEMLTKSQNPKEAAKVLVMASRSEYLDDFSKDQGAELEKTRKALAELQERYDRVKSSGNHSHSTAAAPPTSKPAAKPLTQVSDDEALEAEFAKIDNQS